MIILRNKNNQASSEYEQKLEAQKILDYEISPEISDENISVTKDLKNFKIYLPIDLEYDQYTLSDFIKVTQPGTRSSADEGYDFVILSFNRPLTESTFFKLLKKIIELEGFVTIIDEDLSPVMATPAKSKRGRKKKF